jgi:molybdopterin molybdotransferase
MGNELFTVLPVDEARLKLSVYLPRELRRSESLPLLSCLGRRLSTSVTAGENVPGFARSTVDGYAVRAVDTFGASDSLPAFFPVTGEVCMGAAPHLSLHPGEAIRIATGAMLPPGADAAVMVEYTEPVGSGSIEVNRPVGPAENVIRADEDIKAGEQVFPVNYLLRPQDMGYLAALGQVKLQVFSPLKVGIISTGDEIVPPEKKPGPAQVRDVNSYALYAQVLALGGQAVLYGAVKDDLELLKARLQLAHQECDLVLLSGGSSVGTRDFTAQLISELGEPGLIFHGLAIKPGKPTLGGIAGNKPVFGLPGHPAAALISFEILISPLLKYGSYLQKQPGMLPVRARLSRSLGSALGREEYVRVKLRRDDDIWADPVLGKSGLLTPMVAADGLVRIHLNSEGVAAGDLVDVYLFGTDYFL